LWGVGDATGVGVGLGETSVFVFLRIRFGFCETAAGDLATEGGVTLSTDGVASVLFCAGCVVGVVDSGGVPVSSCD